MLRHSGASWSNPKVLTVLTVIFLCGAAVGSALTSLGHSRPAFDRQTAMERARHIAFDHLRTELNLTPSQEKTITKVLDDYGKYYQNIEDEREDVAEHGKERILSVLDDRQKKRFLELLKNPVLSSSGLE